MLLHMYRDQWKCMHVWKAKQKSEASTETSGNIMVTRRTRMEGDWIDHGDYNCDTTLDNINLPQSHY